LLWVYARDENLMQKEFLLRLTRAMIEYTGANFELDNFDLLLIVQAISHIERSALSSDMLFMREVWLLTSVSETMVIKNFDKLNIQEFTTIALFYLRGG
jgi:hypothetical protein